MKLKYEFNVRQIAGEYILVPMGAGALAFSGMVTTNEVGALICEKLKGETSKEALVEAVCGEFDTTPETAQADLEEFLTRLDKAGLLEK